MDAAESIVTQAMPATPATIGTLLAESDRLEHVARERLIALDLGELRALERENRWLALPESIDRARAALLCDLVACAVAGGDRDDAAELAIRLARALPGLDRA
ncbi:MAG: hypothetical protein ACKPBU_07580, partial [Alphaproteobacteria bacterium]